MICVFIRLLGAVHPTAYDYHNIHEEQQHHDTHSTEEIVYGQPHHETVSEHNAHLTNENFPSDKHTQVYFKTTTEAPYHSDEHQYGHEPQPQPQPYLPHTQVNTYRAPLVYHKLEEEFYNTHDDHGDIGQYASNGGWWSNSHFSNAIGIKCLICLQVMMTMLSQLGHQLHTRTQLQLRNVQPYYHTITMLRYLSCNITATMLLTITATTISTTAMTTSKATILMATTTQRKRPMIICTSATQTKNGNPRKIEMIKWRSSRK